MQELHPCEQPVRVAAVVFFGPALIYVGHRSNEWFVLAFGVGLIMVDGFFVLEKCLRRRDGSGRAESLRAPRANVGLQCPVGNLWRNHFHHGFHETFCRHQTIFNYAEAVVDAMDLKTLCVLATEYIIESLDDHTDEQVIGLIKDYDEDNQLDLIVWVTQPH